MILSRVSLPDCSPSRIIRAAGLSFTEPPGFRHSALAHSSTFRSPLSKLDKRMRGVLPIRSMTDCDVRGTPEVTAGISDCSSPILSNPTLPTRQPPDYSEEDEA